MPDRGSALTWARIAHPSLLRMETNVSAEPALAQSLVGCGEKEKLTPPDKWFAKAKKKIESGHYSFVVDPDAEGGG